MTKLRVPRWFTEGLAVHEETAASPGMGRPPRSARHHGNQGEEATAGGGARSRLHPSDLSDAGGGVVLPGGADLRLHQPEWGWPKLLAMIHDFGAGAIHPRSHPERTRTCQPEEFDKQFMAALNAETKNTVEGFETVAQSRSRRLPN